MVTRRSAPPGGGPVLAIVAGAALLAYGALSSPRVSIRAYPRALFAGGAVRVTCKVPKDATNRGLTVGIRNYRSSFVQLDGEAAPITTEITYERVPCDGEEVFCTLVDNQPKEYTVTASLIINGCDSLTSQQPH